MENKAKQKKKIVRKKILKRRKIHNRQKGDRIEFILTFFSNFFSVK